METNEKKEQDEAETISKCPSCGSPEIDKWEVCCTCNECGIAFDYNGKEVDGNDF